MSLSAEARTQLAAQQAALVTALMARGELPPGFDAPRLRAAAVSLARKRRRSAARAWPGLSRILGRRFDELFEAYTEVATLPAEGGPLADGRAFARWLAAQGVLPETAHLQALAVDLRYRSTQAGLIHRRGSTCRVAYLRRSRRLIVAVKLPWLGECWVSIPLGRRHHPAPA